MSAPAYDSYKESGVEWLGEVPSHWDVKPIKAVASYNDDVLTEATPPDHEIDYVEISDVQAGVGIRGSTSYAFSDAPSRARRRVQDGDIIVSTVRTYLRAIAAITAPAENRVVSTGFAVIRPRAINSRFIGYALLAEQTINQIIARSVGVSYPAINASDLVRIPVSVPPPADQAAIAAFLDRETGKIDALVEAQTRLIELLKEKRQAVISHAVTKGLDPAAPMKDAGVEWLGQVPAHWEVVPLKRLILSTNAGEVIDRSYWGGENELLYTCALEPMECDYPDFPDWKRTSKDDLLLTRNGTPYVHKPIPGAIYTNVVQRVQIDKRSNRDFLALSVQFSARNLRGYGVSIESLNYEMWKELKIAVPPLNEQVEIASYLERCFISLDTLSSTLNYGLTIFQERRAALISAAVTGKIDVRGLAPAQAAAA